MITNKRLKILYLSSNQHSFSNFKNEFLPRLNKEIPLKSACLCTTFLDALNQLHREFDLYISEVEVISDHNETGLDFYRSVRINNEKAPFILMSREARVEHQIDDDVLFHFCPSGDIDSACRIIKNVFKRL